MKKIIYAITIGLLMGLLMGLFIANLIYNFYPIKFKGGFLTPDGWLIVEYKLNPISNLFFRKYFKVRVDDKIVQQHYNKDKGKE